MCDQIFFGDQMLELTKKENFWLLLSLSERKNLWNGVEDLIQDSQYTWNKKKNKKIAYNNKTKAKGKNK